MWECIKKKFLKYLPLLHPAKYNQVESSFALVIRAREHNVPEGERGSLSQIFTLFDRAIYSFPKNSRNILPLCTWRIYKLLFKQIITSKFPKPRRLFKIITFLKVYTQTQRLNFTSSCYKLFQNINFETII